MFYEKNAFKELKRRTSRNCVLAIGKCAGHAGIDEKEPVSILIADLGVLLERAKGEDAAIPMEQIVAFRQTENAIVLKTTDSAAKKLTLTIRNKQSRERGCKLLEKYLSRPADNAAPRG